MKKYRLGLLRLTLIFFVCSAFAGSLPPPPHSAETFREAKLLAKRLYQDHRLTFYCDCKYDKHGKVDLQSCGYKSQKDKRRAERLEWEHIMPVSVWGVERPCWKDNLCYTKKGKAYGGRRCCEKIDQVFMKMEADLHNLVPELGELNALRSNYRFGLLPQIQIAQFGACCIKIDEETRRVEPRLEVRGAIARAYLYMSATYDIALSDSQRQLFEAWHRSYSPDAWEIERDKRIAIFQGNHNPYITKYIQECERQ